MIEAEVLGVGQGIEALVLAGERLDPVVGEDQPPEFPPLPQPVNPVSLGVLYPAHLHAPVVGLVDEPVVPVGRVVRVDVRVLQVPEPPFDPVGRTDRVEGEGDLVVEPVVLQRPPEPVIQHVDVGLLQLRGLLDPDPGERAVRGGDGLDFLAFPGVFHPSKDDPCPRGQTRHGQGVHRGPPDSGGVRPADPGDRPQKLRVGAVLVAGLHLPHHQEVSPPVPRVHELQHVVLGHVDGFPASCGALQDPVSLPALVCLPEDGVEPNRHRNRHSSRGCPARHPLPPWTGQQTCPGACPEAPGPFLYPTDGPSSCAQSGTGLPPPP